MTDILQVRPLHKIADEIIRKWRNPANSAIPYVNAMTYLNTIDQKYGHEDAVDIVLHFLSNASTWRGEDARRIKAELNGILPARYRRR
jgi:hypothetical protein